MASRVKPDKATSSYSIDRSITKTRLFKYIENFVSKN